VDDVAASGALHAVFVRATVAHGRITSIDAGTALGMDGVAGVFLAADLDLPPLASGMVPTGFSRPILAPGVVRFVGEPVAVVVATTRALAIDAAESVLVDYEPLPVVIDPQAAEAADAPLLFPDHGTNVAMRSPFGAGLGAEAEDEVVVRARFVNQRLAPIPMEGNGALAVPDPKAGGLTLWVSCQAAHYWRAGIAELIGLAEHQLRVIAPWVGGGFGAKIDVNPEHVAVCAVALRLGRAVRWFETRSENLTAMTHGRAQIQDVEIAGRRDGTITRLRAGLLADGGAYPGGAAYLPVLTQRMLSGGYRIPRIDGEIVCVCTNTTPINAYRGAGRPEAAALLERAVDMFGAEIGMDPAEVRRVNFVPKDAFPYTTATGAVYDSGDYEKALDEALAAAGYRGLRREQAERRARRDPIQLGIGLSAYVEVTAFGLGSEFGSVEVRPDGSVVVLAGTTPQGQGHVTAFSQIVADAMRVPFDSIEVVHSDTAVVPKGEGTMGSRSIQVGGSAILGAAERVVEKASLIAAHLLEAAPEDIVVADDGRITVAGAPDRAFTWADLAEAATDPSRLPDGMAPGLSASHEFSQAYDGTYPFGVHVSVVEVDTETGHVRLVRHVAVDDCGRVINPILVEGQVHGGVAQGVAQALFEEVVYDEVGNPMTGSLMSYEMPTAVEIPRIEAISTVTPTPANPLGAKGIGESGTIGSTPAVQNAVIDALSHLGVRHIDMPLSPERVWRAIREAPAPADPDRLAIQPISEPAKGET